MPSDSRSKPTREGCRSVPVRRDLDAGSRERSLKPGSGDVAVARTDLEGAAKDRVDHFLATAIESGEFSDTRVLLDALRERVEMARSER